MRADMVIADDHPLVLDALCSMFQSEDFEIVARCTNGLDARAAILQKRPALAVLDVNMPSMTGLAILREASADKWPTRIILLTAGIEPRALREAIQLGVDGLVLKDADSQILLRCAEAVLSGNRWIDRTAMEQALMTSREPIEGPHVVLTKREQHVARLVATGLRNKEIASELGITEGTVKMHLHNLYHKLDITSRTELALLARDQIEYWR